MIYFIPLVALYVGLLMWLLHGWRLAVRSQPQKRVGQQFISVIIAARNEANNLPRLLERLKAQDYPRDRFEIIVVDDHSNDGTAEVIAGQADGSFKLTVRRLGATDHGKKAALSLGIAAAAGAIVATTDADCLVPDQWLSEINDAFADVEVRMIVGLVALARNDFFSRWQAMEFAGVVGTGAATLMLGHPTMCNGANLSFRKAAFETVQGYADNAHIASGDDEFLMRKIAARYPGSIRVMASKSSIVMTDACPSLGEFLQQRLRWAGKWKVNPSVFSKVLAVCIFLFQIGWLGLWITLFQRTNLRLSLLLLAMKAGADAVFLFPVCRHLGVSFRLVSFVSLQFLYPFYVLGIGAFSFWKKVTWKGRNLG